MFCIVKLHCQGALLEWILLYKVLPVTLVSGMLCLLLSAKCYYGEQSFTQIEMLLCTVL